MADISGISGMIGKISKIVDFLADVGGVAGGALGLERLFKKTPSSTAGSKEEAGLKANVFGIGLNDETLFWEAAALAVAKGFLNESTGKKNLNAILRRLKYQEKIHFWKIIGRGEQAITIEIPEKTSTPEVPTANLHTRRGKTRSQKSTTAAPQSPTPTTTSDATGVEKITLTGNIRGAILISYFANMVPTEAVKLLRNSGTLNGVTDDLGQLYKEVTEFLTKTQAGKKVLAQLEKAGLAYLGCATIRSAQIKVAKKERVLAKRQAQSWYERDLQAQPGLPLIIRHPKCRYEINLKKLPIVWLALATFSVAALTYVFAFTH